MTRRPVWAALFLGLLVASLSVNGLDSTTYGGWPAPGLVVGAFLIAGPGWHRPMFLAITVAAGVSISFGYEQPVWAGVLASLALTLPAEITWRILGRPGDGLLRIEQVDNKRYHMAIAISSLACAVLGAVLAAVLIGPATVPMTLLMTFASAISAQLVILPLFLDSDGPATGRPPELMAQRALIAVDALLVFSLPNALPFLFLVFGPMAWAAIRASRREAQLQLVLVCVAGYIFTFLGYGPIGNLDDASYLGPLVIYLFVTTACLVIVPVTLNVELLSHMTTRANQAATTIENLFDAAEHTILVATDAQGRITHFNTGAQEVLGYAPEEVLGRSPQMFHTEEETARQAALLGVPHLRDTLGIARAAAGTRREWVLRLRDGTERIASLSINEVRDSNGRTVGFIAAGEDVTERSRAQEALRAALAREHSSLLRLQEVNHVKQELVSNVSHELRTPITSISGYAELLADGTMGELSAEQVEAVGRIRRNTARLELLVEDLLTMSRAESGQLLLHRERLDLRDVVSAGFELLEEALRERILDVRLVLPDEPVMVHADRHALERVVVNLLSNAVKFTPDHGSASLTVDQTADGARLVVQDTGYGIQPEDQKRLFERFFRAQNATDRAIQGTGLGLSIVHTLVTGHSGSVSIDSAPGTGTTVTVLLPAVREPAEAAQLA